MEVSTVAGVKPIVLRRPKAQGGGGKKGLAVKLGTAGTAACIADLLTFPFDTAKVRLQVQAAGPEAYRGVAGTIAAVARREGVGALYNGLVPGLQRQMVFSAIRIGAYDHAKLAYQDLMGASDGPGALGAKVLAGLTTGSLAILVAQPTDVVKVRMQAAGSPPGPYPGVLSAYTTIARTEGVAGGLYRGLLPNMARNGIVNIGETVVYDAAKEWLVGGGHLEEGVRLHLAAAVLAGLTATLVASPVDVVKTRCMNSRRGAYRGAAHCALVTARTEGLAAFYKGFAPSFARLVSWNVVLWLSYEQLKKKVLIK